MSFQKTSLRVTELVLKQMMILNFLASINGSLEQYSARITMPSPVGAARTDSGEKVFEVARTSTGIK